MSTFVSFYQETCVTQKNNISDKLVIAPSEEQKENQMLMDTEESKKYFFVKRKRNVNN
jgi:hypothetical protein